MYLTERLRPYVTASPDDGEGEARVEAPVDSNGLLELMQRAALLLKVMPRNQRRETIEEIVSPNDPERGRLAVDALIDSAFVTVDEAGHLRRTR